MTPEVAHTGENKENDNRPSTPTNPDTMSGFPRNERTPGRVGPITPRTFDAPEPDIKPFKGPPGKKVRKTRWETDEEYKQYIRATPEHRFHDLYVCFDKGPNGSPTYDRSGFELDYKKVAEWMRPQAYNKRSMVNGMERALEIGRQERKRMAEIFFVMGEAPENPDWARGENYWKDRVSKDLNIPWHKIGVKEFEEWEKRGFPKARKGEYENFTEEEKERMMRLMDGCKLRK